MRRNSARIKGLVLPLLALNVLIIHQLAAAQTPTHPSVPAIMPTLAGPAKPRTTQWEELCTTKGLIAPWLTQVLDGLHKLRDAGATNKERLFAVRDKNTRRRRRDGRCRRHDRLLLPGLPDDRDELSPDRLPDRGGELVYKTTPRGRLPWGYGGG
ncbi:hypothetical protein LZ32DRAFT_690949 [Colletotrichum eremochloae]|nr:hypothetical protein LZ32DRAFT_690949 [Colletotrichum eremochloae]